MSKTGDLLILCIHCDIAMSWKALLLLNIWHKVIFIDKGRYLYIGQVTDTWSKTIL